MAASTDVNVIAGFYFELHRRTQVIIIDYVSFDDIVSGYGGASSVFFYISSIIVGFFIDPFLSASVINDLFNFHENELDEANLQLIKNNFEKNCEIEGCAGVNEKKSRVISGRFIF